MTVGAAARGLSSRREALRLLGAGLAGSMLASWTRAEGRTLLTRAIPSSGEALPAIGLGTWQTFDLGNSSAERAAAAEVLSRLVAGGGRLIDTSPMYGGAESVVGELAAAAGLAPALFLATKVWTSGREAGIEQMAQSLRRLGVSRLDLMQVHNLVDAETHLATLRDWKAAGRVRYVGVTHYTASAYPQLEGMLLGHALDFVQLNYSIASREAERRLLPLAAERGTAVLVNRPFEGSGLFARTRGRTLPAWAAEIGCRSWAQFFLKYVLAHPAVTCVIPATRSVDHLEDNLGAGHGPLPSPPMRRRMVSVFEGL